MQGGGSGRGAGAGGAVLGWGGSGVVAAGGSAAQAWDAGLTALEVTLDTSLTSQCLILAPYSGTLVNFFGRINAVEGAGITVACTVRINQANTGITFQFAGAAQLNGSDIVNTAQVVAGDMIAIGLTRVAGVPPGLRYVFDLQLA